MEHTDSPVLSEAMLSLSKVGEVSVLGLSAPAILDEESAVLGRYFSELARQSQGRVVLELSGVVRFSCAWINTLIRMTRQCDEMGGRLVVCGLSPIATRLVRTTGISKHLNIAGSRREALRMHGEPSLAPWRMAVAKMLDIPVPSRAA